MVESLNQSKCSYWLTQPNSWRGRIWRTNCHLLTTALLTRGHGENLSDQNWPWHNYRKDKGNEAEFPNGHSVILEEACREEQPSKWQYGHISARLPHIKIIKALCFLQRELQRAKYLYLFDLWSRDWDINTLLSWRKLVEKGNHKYKNMALSQPIGQNLKKRHLAFFKF